MIKVKVINELSDSKFIELLEKGLNDSSIEVMNIKMGLKPNHALLIYKNKKKPKKASNK